MDSNTFSRLAAFVADQTTRRATPVLATHETYTTLRCNDGTPVATLSRPRLYSGLSEFYTLCALDGALIAVFAASPSHNAVTKEIRAFTRAGAGLDDMPESQLYVEIDDCKEREGRDLVTTVESKFSLFRANAKNRAIRAARRAAIAAGLIRANAARRAAEFEKAHALPRGRYATQSGAFPLWAFDRAPVDHMRDYDPDSVWSDMGIELETGIRTGGHA